jgi:hypothetical protein
MTYEQIGAEVGKLVTEKQKQYGDSFTKAGQIMRILYEKGIPTEAMAEALTVVRVLDKLNRIATARGGPDLGGESPWRDIAGYSLLELGKHECHLQDPEHS